MTENNKTPQTFSSLTDICQAKEALRQDIRKQEDVVAELWNDLFHKPEEDLSSSPTRRAMSMVNMGAGVIDGLLLGWKLYRKFQNTRLPFFTKRKKH